MNALDVLKYTTNEDSTRYKHLTKCRELGEELLSDILIDEKIKEKILNTILLHDIGYSEKLKDTGIHAIDGYRYLDANYPDLCFHKAIYMHSDFVNVCPDNYKEESNLLYDSMTDLEFATLLIVDYCDSHIDGYGNEVTINGRWEDLENRYKTRPVVLAIAKTTKEYAFHVERIINRILDILPILK